MSYTSGFCSKNRGVEAHEPPITIHHLITIQPKGRGILNPDFRRDQSSQTGGRIFRELDISLSIRYSVVLAKELIMIFIIITVCLLYYIVKYFNKNHGGQVFKVGSIYLWRIENYSKLPERGHLIRSSKFEIEDKTFTLELYKNKNLLILMRHEGYELDHLLYCEFSLFDNKGKAHRIGFKTVAFKSQEVCVEKINFASEIFKNSVLPHDTLTVVFAGKLMDVGGKTLVFQKDSEFLEILSSDLESLYRSESNSADVVLEAGDRKFPVHRVILSARSKVFAAMFQHDMLEKKAGTVHISDIAPDILEEALYYIYTGKVREQNAATAILLFAAADKYAMDVLKNKCRNVIIATLTTENISHAATLADTYQDEAIMSVIGRFFKENQEEILRNQAWNNFMAEKPLLANDILVSALKGGTRVV